MRRVGRFLLLLSLLLCPNLLRAQNNQNVTVQYGIQIGPGHSVDLKWIASATPGITSYNIYRSTISGSAFTKIASVSAVTLVYTDGGLPAGNTYFYVITSVSSGGESTFSNQVTGAIPQP